MKQITEDYVSYEIAVLLKEKGFNEPCLMCYTYDKNLGNYGNYNSYKNSDVFSLTSPTYQMALKWLREVKKIHISLYAVLDLPEEGCIPEKITYTYNILDAKEPFHFFDDYDDIINPPQFNSYEQAVEAALLYVLKNLI